MVRKELKLNSVMVVILLLVSMNQYVGKMWAMVRTKLGRKYVGTKAPERKAGASERRFTTPETASLERLKVETSSARVRAANV